MRRAEQLRCRFSRGEVATLCRSLTVPNLALPRRTVPCRWGPPTLSGSHSLSSFQEPPRSRSVALCRRASATCGMCYTPVICDRRSLVVRTRRVAACLYKTCDHGFAVCSCSRLGYMVCANGNHSNHAYQPLCPPPCCQARQNLLTSPSDTSLYIYIYIYTHMCIYIYIEREMHIVYIYMYIYTYIYIYREREI